MGVASVQTKEARIWGRDEPKPDPRMEAFADWILAYDRRDWPAGHDATIRLRRLGISVVLTTPNGTR